MKKLYVALVAAVWASAAFAGSYHRGNSLICSDCHTMHASRTHLFGGAANTGTDTFTNGPGWVQGGAGNEYLLVAADPIETCLACHDGKAGLPDVMGANVNSNQRPGGFLSEFGAGGETNGHTMLAPLTNPPGWSNWRAGQANDVWTNSPANGFSAEFECDDCHAVHGNAAYRNLANGRGRVAGNYGWTGNVTVGYKWGVAPTYSYGATAPAAGKALIPTTFDVDVVTVPSGKSVGNINQGDQYDVDRIAYTIAASDVTPVKYAAGYNTTTGAAIFYDGTFAADQNGGTLGKNKMNGFCGACHGNFHGDTNTSLTPTTGKFKKHPTTGVAFTSSNTIKGTVAGLADLVIKPVFNANTAQGGFEPGCLTCHKAHGTKNSFGIVTPADPIANNGALYNVRDTDLESGDGALATGGVRQLCIQCHGQGRTGAADQLVP